MRFGRTSIIVLCLGGLATLMALPMAGRFLGLTPPDVLSAPAAATASSAALRVTLGEPDSNYRWSSWPVEVEVPEGRSFRMLTASCSFYGANGGLLTTGDEVWYDVAGPRTVRGKIMAVAGPAKRIKRFDCSANG